MTNLPIAPCSDLAKGRDLPTAAADLPTAAAPAQQFPKTTQVQALSSRLSPLLGRTFESKEEYDEAIADFKNGN